MKNKLCFSVQCYPASCLEMRTATGSGQYLPQPVTISLCLNTEKLSTFFPQKNLKLCGRASSRRGARSERGNSPKTLSCYFQTTINIASWYKIYLFQFTVTTWTRHPQRIHNFQVRNDVFQALRLRRMQCTFLETCKCSNLNLDGMHSILVKTRCHGFYQK